MGDFDIGKDSLLSIDDICKKLSISRSTLDRWRGDHRNFPVSYLTSIGNTGGNEYVKDFPKPMVYFGKSPRWSANEINHWLANLPASSNNESFTNIMRKREEF